MLVSDGATTMVAKVQQVLLTSPIIRPSTIGGIPDSDCLRLVIFYFEHTGGESPVAKAQLF